MAKRRKSFAGYSAGQARAAASSWLANFEEHGPLDIKSIRVTEDRHYFIATVIYADAPAEPAPPQYFADYEPVLLKSA